MVRFFGLSSRQVGAAMLASCIAAGVIISCAGMSAADGFSRQTISVNRINKGDRLPGWLIREPARGIATSALNMPLPAPLACDPAFSPIADPAHVRVYMRCLS